MANEKSFQTYFMKILPHGYRTSLVNGSGFPDILAIRREEHFLIELKMLHIGVSGNKKLKGLFQPTQIPWYYRYLKEGGTRLYVMFRLEDNYGLLHVSKEFCKNINTLKYLDMVKDWANYTEYKSLKELVDENFI